jgi:stage III sporulation protein AB
LDFIKELVSISENEADIHKAWSEAVKKSVFGNEEREIMLLFGNMLGTSDINGQVSAIELYKKRLDNLFNELKTEYESKGRMYRSVGVLIGIMAGILLV